MKIKILLTIVIFLNLEYLFWVRGYLNGSLGYLLYAAEWGLLSLTILFFICHWERTGKRKVRHRAKGRVDVFVTSYDEPISMISKTLSAAVSIDYPHKKVFLLDDGHRPELKNLARNLGATYFSRKKNTHAKAGNLNAALKKTYSPYILVLDADQVAKPSIIKKMLGHFQDSDDIAVVTTRQQFDVHENDFNHDHMFYAHMQSGKDCDDCPTSTGSGVIYLRSALEEIGGFETWNLVEDLTTTYELNRAGYTSLYVNEPLTKGLAPQDIKNIYKQRGTWATDGLRLLFKKNILFSPRLTMSQRFHYLEMTLQYFVSATVIPVILIVPIISLITNIPALLIGTEYLLYRGPSLAAILYFYWYLNKGHANNKFWAGLWPVYLKSIFLALKPKKCRYKVTQKVEEERRRIHFIIPQLTVMLLGIAAVPLAIHQYGFSNSVLNNSFWVLVNVWWMSTIVKRGFVRKHPHRVTIHEAVLNTAYA